MRKNFRVCGVGKSRVRARSSVAVQRSHRINHTVSVERNRIFVNFVAIVYVLIPEYTVGTHAVEIVAKFSVTHLLGCYHCSGGILRKRTEVRVIYILNGWFVARNYCAVSAKVIDGIHVAVFYQHLAFAVGISHDSAVSCAQGVGD